MLISTRFSSHSTLGRVSLSMREDIVVVSVGVVALSCNQVVRGLFRLWFELFWTAD